MKNVLPPAEGHVGYMGFVVLRRISKNNVAGNNKYEESFGFISTSILFRNCKQMKVSSGFINSLVKIFCGKTWSV